jgi:hypothetical protein
MKRSILHIETMAQIVMAFQNTRRRPITDEVSASVWREFDSLCSHRQVVVRRRHPVRERGNAIASSSLALL